MIKMQRNSVRNTICLFVLFCFSSSSQLLFSQAYDSAIGIRLGSDFGITAVQRFAKRSSAEIIYEDGLFDSNRNVQLLAKQHLPLISKRINFYTGIGLGYIWHLGRDNNILEQSPIIPLTLGAELTFGRLNIAADFQPIILFNKFNDNRVIRSSGVSLRYVLIKRKKKNSIKDTFSNIFKSKNNNGKSKKK